ncbi:MAG: aspartate aminotransferase family protein [Acidobacteriaceae bacterium]|nr:aspartate aminotransferase family protein [Acidobacteriaceae bacterium]
MDFSKLSFPDAPSIKTPPPGPKSQQYLDFQSVHEGSVVSYSKGMPMAIDSAKGATVRDVDGNSYIDFFGGAGVMNVGHSNPAVVDAVTKQIGQLTHALDFPTASRKLLIEKLSALLPKGLSRVSFGGPTGSDAVESAIKLAKFNTRRQPIVAFEGSYHGMTAGALSVTSGRQFREPFLPLAPEVHFVPYAYCYRCAFNQTPDKCSVECAQYLNHVLEDPHSGVGKPAAVIVEAIQGEGGSIVPPPQFIPKVREICDKHEVVMIADEVQSGFCRTGKMFAFEHTNTVPDVVTMSKALGGIGLPISGIAYREKLNTWPAAQHIGTFRGNVAAYAGGAAALDFMVGTNLADHAAKLGEHMLASLRGFQIDSRIVGDVRGKGLMLGIEFVKDKGTKQPHPDAARAVRSACHRRGLLTEVGGHYNNVARFLPPLVLTHELAESGLSIFMDAVKEVERSM